MSKGILPGLSGQLASAVIPGQLLTPATAVEVYTGRILKTWSKYTWSNALVAALPSTTGNIKVCTLPARTKVTDVLIRLDGAAAGITALTVSLGRTSAAYIDYIVASNAKSAANTLYGAASGSRGTNLTGYDLPSITAAVDVYLQFISAVEDLSTATGSSGTIWIETATLP